MSIAVISSPELNAQEIYNTGKAVKFITLLQRCTAAAVGRGDSEILLSNISFTLPAATSAALLPAIGTLMAFDVDYRFCSTSQALPPLYGASFDSAFSAEAQQFALSFLGTYSVSALRPLGSGNSSSAGGSSAFGTRGSASTTSSGSDSKSGVVLLAVLLSVGGVLVLAACAAAAVVRFRRRRRSKLIFPDDGEEQAGATLAADAILAHVACSFSPLDVEDDKIFRESCLELQPGDVIEVIAGGGGWLYGRVLQDSEAGEERMGYFPENRVSWMGTIAGLNATANPHVHYLCTVDGGFRPSEVDSAYDNTEHCLQLEPGESVEVMASAGGWLYGQVVGDESRRGYFPESTALRIGQDSDAAAASGARTDAPPLVRVEEPFRGSGGLKKMSSFSESCLEIKEGDVMEVLASAGGWLYGRVVGAPDRVGYFPETRVTWIGRPTSAVPSTRAVQATPMSTPSHAATQDAMNSPSQASGASDGLRATGVVESIEPFVIGHPATD